MMSSKKILLLTFVFLVALWVFNSNKFFLQENKTDIVNLSTTPIATTTLKNSFATTTASTTPIKNPEKKQEKKVATSTSITKKPLVPPPPPPPPAPEPTPDFQAINTFARKSIVNILCTVSGNELSPISATGVVITPDGIVLTNAHVGQYFLLRDFRQKNSIECILRTGSPAYPTYHAKLVYISPIWIQNNKTVLKENDPTGTGENDFAFLKITDKIDGTNLPGTIPYLISDVREVINLGEPVVLVSYPAGFLGGIAILQNLSITSAITNIQGVFTFNDKTTDLIGVGGTVVSQKGASGGAVVDENATLIGIITTSSEANSTSQRDLRAITLAYINRDLQAEEHLTLDDFLRGDTNTFAKNFEVNVAPGLTKLITDELNKNL